MKYYEFIKGDYYALIAVEESEDSIKEAMEVYVREVAYDTLEEMIEDKNFPAEIQRDEALLEFLEAVAKTEPDITVRKAINDFKECKNATLLIDGSLT